MVSQSDLDALRLELSVKAKNGLDFLGAASLIWTIIAVIWWLPGSPAYKGLLTFWVGGLLLPLAWGLSKIFKTTWTMPGNPLQPLGLWLNFAQLFYFPILLFIYGRLPQYFIMTYAIITGAHFFPYAWFYNVRAFAVMAGVISVGALVIGLRTTEATLYLIPVFMVGALVVLSGWLAVVYRRNARAYALAAPVAAAR